MDPTYTARCACGSVTIRSPRAPLLQLTCHCAQCREASGQPSTNFAFFRAAETEVTGATTVRAFTADSGHATTRESCADCGQMMVDRTAGFPKIVGIVAERIAPPYVFTPGCHVWLANAVARPEIPAGVAAHEQGLP